MADADIAAARALLDELARRREDARLSAGELLLPLPEIGSDLARVMLANRLLRREVEDLARLARENRALRAENKRLRTASPGDAPAPTPVVRADDHLDAIWRGRVLCSRPATLAATPARALEQVAQLSLPLGHLEFELYAREVNALDALLAGVADPLVAHAAAVRTYDLIRRKGVGRKSVRHVEERLAARGLSLDMAIDPERYRATAATDGATVDDEPTRESAR